MLIPVQEESWLIFIAPIKSVPAVPPQSQVLASVILSSFPFLSGQWSERTLTAGIELALLPTKRQYEIIE